MKDIKEIVWKSNMAIVQLYKKDTCMIDEFLFTLKQQGKV